MLKAQTASLCLCGAPVMGLQSLHKLGESAAVISLHSSQIYKGQIYNIVTTNSSFSNLLSRADAWRGLTRNVSLIACVPFIYHRKNDTEILKALSFYKKGKSWENSC